jgi:hypothetical protein
MLPTIATHIDGMLKAAQEQYETLLPAKVKPHVLDDYTINRVKKVFTTHLNDLWLFEEQLARWKSGSLTEEQQTEVERLVGQMKKLQEQIIGILDLADGLAKGTIENVMAKSDGELGLESLLNQLKDNHS